MKFKVYGELLDDRNILSYLFLECMPPDIAEKVAALPMDEDNPKEKTIEMDLFIAGHKVDLRRFIEVLHSSYNKLVKTTAEELIQERTSERLLEMQNKIQEYSEIIEDWSKDINWDVENPFKK